MIEILTVMATMMPEEKVLKQLSDAIAKYNTDKSEKNKASILMHSLMTYVKLSGTTAEEIQGLLKNKEKDKPEDSTK